METTQSQQKINIFSKILHNPSTGGILLILSAILAIYCMNSDLYYLYKKIIYIKIFATDSFTLDTHFIVNEILMTLFFLYVGLEIKRELVAGELSKKGGLITPLVAAIGGVVVPALIYVLINKNSPESFPGWAIPSATDIAFALGILSLLGSRVPLFLKVFLTTLAIIDDLAAIIIIALFYSSNTSFIYIGISLICVLALYIMNRKNINNIYLYSLAGAVLWYFVFKSGIHVTIAGVVLGIMIPQNKNKDSCIAHKLEHSLDTWSKFMILPLFAFFNSGISFKGMSMSDAFSNPAAVGVLLGLVVGKQLGVFLFTFLVYKMKFAQKPDSISYLQIYGTSIMTGIGFTMSIFITNLAFSDQSIINNAKIGVIAGSIISTLLGIIVLYIACNPSKNTQKEVKE